MDSKVKIVLTDTNEEAREMLQAALERTGRFIVAGSTGDGEEALRMVREIKPDLFVLDLLLPNMDGLGILRRLRDDENRPTILAMSNFPSQEMLAEASILGASQYISKPYNEDAMVESLQKLSEKREEQVRAPGLEEPSDLYHP